MSLRESRFEAIGTRWLIQTPTDIPDHIWLSLMDKIDERIGSFDKTYSRFRKDSLVAAMSREAGEYDMPKDGFKLFSFYEKLYEATGGQVTPLIGQALSDAGYDSKYSLEPKAMTKPPRWEDVLDFDKTSIRINRPVLLDFGATGKGYLVDIIGQMMEEAGIKDLVIDGSGDILHRGIHGDSLEIGLENPFDTSQAIGVASLRNESMCASAGSRRKWGRYNHILDPSTLESPKDIAATWVIAADTMTADGLSTALFFSSPTELGAFDFEYALLRSGMTAEYSKGFPAKMFEAVA